MCVIGNYNVNVYVIKVCIYASIKAKFIYPIQTKKKVIKNDVVLTTSMSMTETNDFEDSLLFCIYNF